MQAQQQAPQQELEHQSATGAGAEQGAAQGGGTGGGNQDRLAAMRDSEQGGAEAEEEVPQQDAEGELAADSDQEEPPETDASPGDVEQEGEAEEPETPEEEQSEDEAAGEGEAQAEEGATEEEVPATEAAPELPAVDDSGRAATAAATLSTAVADLGATSTVDFAGVDVRSLFGADASPEEREAADAQFQGDRAASAAAVDGFVARTAVRAEDLDTAGQQLQAEISAAAAQARAAIELELATSVAAVEAGIAGLIAQASQAAEALRATISGAYDATVATLEAATATGHETLATSLSDAEGQIDIAAEAQIATVDTLYGQCGPAFARAGEAAGQLAMTEAAGRATSYLGGKIWREDGPLDGYLTDNRCDAQAEAATKVGECYRDELKKAADEQATAALDRKPTDEAAVWSVADETKAQVLAAFDGATASLDTGLMDSLASAEALRASLITGVDQAESDTIAGLESHQDTTVSALQAQATTASEGVTAQADTASADLTTALADAASQLQTSVQGLLDQLGGADAPPPEDVAGAIATADAEVETAIATVLEQVEAGKLEVLSGLGDARDQACIALQEATTGALDAGQQTLDGLLEGLGELETSAAEGFGEVELGHQDAVDLATDGLDGGVCDLLEGLDSAYETLSDNLGNGFTQQAQTVQDGLENAVRTDMSGAITEEARKAYDQVQPRWKSVVKWILIIAVVLVVAIVLGPMVIGAVTGLAAGLGASTAAAGIIGTVVGGAIVGAGTSAATTIIDNGFSGRDLTEGIGKAMLIGAVGGALGGAGGLLTKGLSGMTQFGASVALDMTIDTGINLATGNFTWENFGVGLLMSAFTNGISMNSRVQGWQQSNMSLGYRGGFAAGQGIHGLATGGSGYSGPAPTTTTDRSAHTNVGDSKQGGPNAGDWNMKGGGHNAQEMPTRAADAGYGNDTVAVDPQNGTTIQEYSRPKMNNDGSPVIDGAGNPEMKTTRKTTFPDSMGTPDIDAMGNQVLGDAMAGKGGTSLTAPGSNQGKFSGTGFTPDGHPILVEGHYKVDPATGQPQVQTVYPVGDMKGGTFPSQYNGYGAPPLYATPPNYGAPEQDED